MSETATATTTEKAEFKCSCGRTFAHEISLKRHRWVTGHAELEVEDTPAAAPAVAAVPAATPASTPAATAAAAPALAAQFAVEPEPMIDFAPQEPGQDAYSAAMDILMAKVREQQELERMQRRDAMLQTVVDFGDWMGNCGLQALNQGGQAAGKLANVTGQALALAARVMVVFLFFSGLLLAGLTAGRVMATRSQAAERPAQAAPTAGRQLIGAHSAAAAATVSGPSRVVEEYYANLSQQKLSRAYALLSPDFQRQLDYATFESGYAGMHSLSCDVQGERQLDANTARVDFTVVSDESNGSRRFEGYYLLVRTDDGWQIDRAQLAQI